MPTPNKKGRGLGTKNGINMEIRRGLLEAFNKLGGVQKVVRWAKKSDRNYCEFLKILSRILPREIVGEDGEGITVIIKRAENATDISTEQLHSPAIPE
jgi:hypothetical protein